MIEILPVPQGKHGLGWRWDCEEPSLSILFKSTTGPITLFYRYRIACHPSAPDPNHKEGDGLAHAHLLLPPLCLPFPRTNLELATWEEYLANSLLEQ